MGGKTGTTTSSVQIPPEVLARYNAVNAQAQKTAATPFQQYSTDPNAFVAPLNEQQQAGINNINQQANAAQPGYQAGMNTTGSAINQINAGQNVAQPYFGGAQTIAAGAIPQYQQAAGLAGAAMTPLQQATYAAQPGYQAAQAGTMAAGAGTGQTIGQLGNISQGYNAPNYQAGVAGYMNPFLQNAMGSTAAMMQNQNQQQQNQLQGNAISSGAFGGDRGNIAQAALMGQQNLAMGQTLGQMANTGYQSAAQNYMSGLGAQAGIAGQQGAMYGQMGNLANQYGQLGGQAQQALINAGQAQQAGAANIANIAGQGMNAAGQYGALGTAAQNAALQGVPLSLAAGAQQGALGAGAQTAGLQGAQAQVGAGTLGQQTTQAGLSALYNQFQQQQAYPFQVSQFLANIAEGTGALSGSTTTTTGPQSWFSDARLKEDIKQVGTADNGLPIYNFKYKGDPTEQTHIGYMAQDVEKVHPEAVGESNGFKTVNYEKASRPAHYSGGVVANSEGGVVSPMHMREGYFDGGDVVSPYDLSAILASQKQSYAPFQQGGLYGSSPAGTPGGKGVVPAANLPVGHLAVANPARTQQGDTFMGDVQNAENIGDRIAKANQYRKDIIGNPATPAKPAVPANPQTGDAAQPAVPAQPATGIQGLWADINPPQAQKRGGIVAYADGGDVEPYQADDPMSQVVSDTDKDKNHQLMTAQNPTGQGSSTFGDISKLVGTGTTIAGIPNLVSGIGTAASTVGSGIGSLLAALALKDGGVAENREHHDGSEGNVVGDSTSNDQPKITPDYVRDVAAKSAVNAGIDPTRPLQIGQMESGFNYNAVADDHSSFGPWQMHYGNMSEKYPHGGLGDIFTKETGYDLRDPNVRSDPKAIQANADWVANYMAKNGDSAWSTARQLDSKNTQANVASQSNNAPAESAPKDNGILSTLGNMFGIGSAQAQEAPKPGQKSLGDTLMSEQFLIPLLSGIGTMAGSNSRYLGAAILQGIGGGAKAYEDVQSNLASRGLTGAQTNVENTVAASNAQQISQNDRHLDPFTKTEIIDMPNNKTMTLQEYRAAGSPPTRSMVAAGILQNNMAGISAQPAPNQAAPPPAQNAPAAAPAVAPAAPSIVSTPLPPPAAETPAATPFSVGNAGKMQLQKDNDIFNNSAPTVRTPLLADSTAAEKKIYDEANNAHDMGMTLNNLTSRILAEPDTGVASPGVINALKSHAANTYNNLMATIGHPEMAVAGQDLNNAAVIDKIHTGLGFLTTTNADQNSREALQAAFAGTPGTQMTKAAALDVVTSMYVAKQRALDQQKYLQEWKNQAAQNQDTGGQYLAQNAQAAFRQDHNDTSYQLEKHNLRNLLGPIDQNGNPIMNKGVPLPAPSALDKNGNPVKLFDLAANPTLSKYGDKTPQLVEKYAKSPYLSRYISNQ